MRASHKELFALLGLLGATAVLAYVVQRFIPDSVKDPPRSVEDVPVEWEIRFKDRIKDYIRYDATMVEDEVILTALGAIEHRLVSRLEDTPYDIEIIVVESPVANAFTMPGGLVVVFTPLIRLTESPEELAAVLAHEMGHSVRRDPLRRLMRQVGVSAVISLVKGGESTLLLEDAITQLIDARYTREQEEQADRFACEHLARCGIDPVHFARFMEKLQSEGDSRAPAFARYLRTHPATASRIARAREASASFRGQDKPFALDWPRVKSHLPSIFSSRNY